MFSMRPVQLHCCVAVKTSTSSSIQTIITDLCAQDTNSPSVHCHQCGPRPNNRQLLDFDCVVTYGFLPQYTYPWKLLPLSFNSSPNVRGPRFMLASVLFLSDFNQTRTSLYWLCLRRSTCSNAADAIQHIWALLMCPRAPSLIQQTLVLATTSSSINRRTRVDETRQLCPR